MTRRILRWLLPGILAYLVFLCATFPADYALHGLQPSLPAGMQLNGVSGSIWSGQARQLIIDSVVIGALRWRFDWRAPWHGRLGYHLQLKSGDLQLAGRAAFGRNQQIVIHALTGRVPVARLDHWLPLPRDSVTGQLQFDLPTLVFRQGLPQSADGSVTLTSARLHWPQTAVLGNYRLQLRSGKTVQGEIRDTGGPLALQAQVSLQSGGVYQVQGTLSARDAASAAAQLLPYLGVPDAGGRYRFDFTGRLQ